jgi:hypothetical protein
MVFYPYFLHGFSAQ